MWPDTAFERRDPDLFASVFAEGRSLPAVPSYGSDSLRRYNSNNNAYIELIDDSTCQARSYSFAI